MRILDTVLNAPAKVAEVTAETLVQLPDIAARTIDGAIRGVEQGIDKVTDRGSR